jgi:hypothetical protein
MLSAGTCLELVKLLLILTDSLYPKAPATTGAFYFFNKPQTAPKAIGYLAPLRPSTANLEPFFMPQATSTISSHSKASYLHS